ncbi:hypothetical protein [Caballeronia sp. LZ001]|uniref:hypothetical protein n=1 Tax=Caballeronia sp. LZ001 TaxID=3038553 RepID=UPI00285DF99E|nr:hypothetical protein [Caballeronia sp. LZ001]MDR5806525.1 hypothetical protein [Caballeronia sp. LZ001]
MPKRSPRSSRRASTLAILALLNLLIYALHRDGENVPAALRQRANEHLSVNEERRLLLGKKFVKEHNELRDLLQEDAYRRQLNGAYTSLPRAGVARECACRPIIAGSAHGHPDHSRALVSSALARDGERVGSAV